MAGQIVSASVGGATAGSVVINEPVGAGYATWPDLLRKEVADIFAIFNDRLARGGADPDDDRVMMGGAPSTPSTAKAAVFGFPVVILLAILAWLLFARR